MASVVKPPMLTLKLNDVVELDEKSLEKLYCWVDDIPLSRAKKNLARDFSDGVMVAELIQYFIPKLVEMHCYSPGSSTRVKEHNWYHMNRKVLRKLEFELDEGVIRNIVHCRPWAIENFLLLLREKMDSYMMLKDRSRQVRDYTDEAPEADQASHLVSQGFVPADQISRHTQMKSNRIQGVAKPFLSPRNKAGQELVPKALLAEKQQELSLKEETIQILNAKITGLEKLISLKDIRIDDLTARINEVEHYRPPARGLRKAQSQPRHMNEVGVRRGSRGGLTLR